MDPLGRSSSASAELYDVEHLERILTSPRQIVEERAKALNDTDGMDGCGLARSMVRMLCDAADAWTASVRWRCQQLEMSSSGTRAASEEKNDYDVEAAKFGVPSSLGSSEECIIAGSPETERLHRMLSLHLTVGRQDSTLAEEMGKEGSHVVFSRLARFDLELFVDSSLSSNGKEDGANSIIREADEDAFIEMQDIACETGSLCGGAFPMKYAPYTRDELLNRLPLQFTVKAVVADQTPARIAEFDIHVADKQSILIHQVTARQSAQKDVGFVMWPSAVVLSTWVVSNPSIVQKKRILELGAGCGLVGLAAAGVMAAGARGDEKRVDFSASHHSYITMTDFNETVLHNLDRNIRLNDLSLFAKTKKLDFYDQRGQCHSGGWLDGSQTKHEPVDVVLAADVICKPEDAVAAANTIYDCLKPGGCAFVVSADAKHRFGVERFRSDCHRLGMNVSVFDVKDLYAGQLLSSTGDLEKTSGFVEGMTLTMFQVTKQVV